MTSASRLVDEVLGELQAFTTDTEQVTSLTSDLDSSSLTFTVSDVRSGLLGISPGVVEIGTELLYVGSVATDGTATVVPWGRGYQSTTAAAHSNGSRVISQPTFPRYWILQKINETIQRVAPEIFTVKTQTTTATTPVFTYNITAADALSILRVEWQPPTGLGYWQSVKRFRFNVDSQQIDIADVMTPGSPLRIKYRSTPSPLASEADDFETVTGLPTSMRDVLVIGAATALTTPQELSRLQTASIEQQDRSRLVAPSAALTSSRYLEQTFQARLKEEVQALRQKYPPRVTREWV